jgi:asparagine synthase (glutamine-hydrolysing)
MCGFVAVAGNYKNILGKAIEKINYRGLPGQIRYHSQKDIHIAHTRLPIVDLSYKGDQPARIGNHIGFLVGEAFNFRKFSSKETDTAAMLELFLQKGIKGFHQIDGFWSFVTIYENKLFAANDYLSQKPIYYRTDLKVIASEPIALLGFKERNNFDEIFFSNVRKWGYDMTGRTPWANIKQLPPGHYWHDGDIKPYWDWNNVCTTGVKEAVIEATKNRLLGDLPIACLLSGGLDSSIVYSLCRQLGSQIQSYHIENEESEFAKLIDPETKVLNLEGLAYSEAIRDHQSPVDLGSVHPQAILGQAVNKTGYRVCLTGDGADELFGGYSRNEKYDSQSSDVFMELPYYHLPKLDRLMMRYTVELRSPFLSSKVVKAALALPYHQRQNKQPLKEAFKNILPEAILKREKKALKTLRIKNGGIKQIEENIKTFKGIYL